MNEPGQFVHIKSIKQHRSTFRRPISIAKLIKDNNEFTMIYRAEGKGTISFAEKKAGDEVDVFGPLEMDFQLKKHVRRNSSVSWWRNWCSSFLRTFKQFVNKGVKVIHVLGFQTKEAVFYEREFASLVKHILQL